jgi:hypothetical protein
MICQHCGEETSSVICEHCGINCYWFNKYHNVVDDFTKEPVYDDCEDDDDDDFIYFSDGSGD